MKNIDSIKILTSLLVIGTLLITSVLPIGAETIINSTNDDILFNVNSSPNISYKESDESTQFNQKILTPEKKYAVIMVGRYFGMWNFGKPGWNYNQIQQYYTWYTNRAGRMYKLLNETYGWDTENIFLLIRLLPECFTYGDDFSPSMKSNLYSASKSDLNNLLNTFKPGGSRELDENDMLVVCLIDHGGVYNDGGINWISPDLHICGNWKHICKSYDNNLQTESIYNSVREGWSDTLTLKLSQPLNIKGFRIDANQNNFDKIELKFYKDSNLLKKTNLYRWIDSSWNYSRFSNIIEVNKVEIRFHENNPYFGFKLNPAKVFEFDFWPADGPDDVIKTFMGCAIQNIPDFLEWIFGSGTTTQLYDTELAEYVDGIDSNITFILHPCHSGGFIDDLSGKNHIICTSTRGYQVSEEDWLDNFVAGLNENDVSDYNNDGKWSIWEAYKFSSDYVVDHISGEHPLIDDNEDGVGSHYIDTEPDPVYGVDGYNASVSFLSINAINPIYRSR